MGLSTNKSNHNFGVPSVITKLRINFWSVFLIQENRWQINEKQEKPTNCGFKAKRNVLNT